MFGFLLFISIYLPFQLALSPSQGIDLASGRILILVLFFIWLAESFKNKKLLIQPTFTNGLFVSFLFLTTFSLIVSQNLEWSGRKLLFLFSLAPLYFIAQNLLNSEEKKEKIASFLVWGSSLASLIGIFQFISQFIFGREKVYQFWADYVVIPFLGKAFSEAVLLNPSWLVNITGQTYLRATAFFPDPHMLSFFLGLIFPLALALVFLKKENKIWNLANTIIILITDLLTFSRGGYLGLFLGLLFLALVFWKNFSRRYRWGTIISSVFLVSFVFIPGPIKERFQSSFDLREGSNRGRLETWVEALEVIEKKPLLGTGLGNYPLEIKASADYREPIYAHNTYLDVAAETGILNALIWIGFLFFTARGLYKSKNKFLVFASASIVIFSVHSLVETGIYSVAVWPALLIISSLNNE